MKTYTFATALVAVVQATHIVYREDVDANLYKVDHADYPFAFPWPKESPICGGSMVSP